ncbi:hypothetical protein MLA66_003799 [Salmonella enterica]|nr:hypothetical protein [Salmonella enterica]EEM7111614.1 hypothetical protein [Salmonella enterica subsp. enterica serovar Poona]HBI5524027.1 hypothetical protein [Salmonella enterica subsp. enterica serovar Welikade]EAS9890755.1 hypothetical protein [Salmonella enterica]EEG2847015.1 hypothetical protein [Salmonella enterica]
MTKDDLKHFRKEIKDVRRSISLAAKRLNEGRYKDAKSILRRESVALIGLADELRDITEQQGG